MIVTNTPAKDLACTNFAYCSPSDLPNFIVPGSKLAYAFIGDAFVLSIGGHEAIPSGHIGLNAIQRRYAKVSSCDSVSVSRFIPPENFNLALLSVELELVKKGAKEEQVDAEALSQQILRRFINQIMTTGQRVTFEFYGNGYLFTVNQATVEGQEKSHGIERGMISADTYIIYEASNSSGIKVANQREAASSNIFRHKEFNLESFGIGGLSEEVADIFRRAFASRVFPPHVTSKLGIKHVKGMLLFGPPGTGKTLMARQIGKMLNGKEPKIVNGPEILSKFIGETEKNVCDLFADAEQDQKTKGDQSDLHIIIFDEIDAICKSRGSTRDGTGVHDSIVNQLLTKIDGVESLNNVLLIGMTNRRDLLDEALLRPGRLEVQVEISLPDENGRLQILQIHTNKMKENSFLAPDVNFEEIAARTKNYSGAELEGVVKSAVSYALDRQLNMDDLTKPVGEESIKVTMDDFLHALQEIIPDFGASTDDLDRCRTVKMVCTMDEIFPKQNWADQLPNNLELNFKKAICPDPIILHMLRNHPLYTALTITECVPEVYVQQFWATMKNPTNRPNTTTLTAQIDNTPVILTKHIIRTTLNLPLSINSDPHPSDEALINDFIFMGYKLDANRSIHLPDFTAKDIPQPWRTLFLIINKCLSPKHSGSDKCNRNIMLIFHGIVFNKQYDVVQLIWSDLLDQLRRRDVTKTKKVLPYMRWFPVFVKHLMNEFPEIERRDISEGYIPAKLRSLHSSKTKFDQEAMIIPDHLLQLIDPTTPVVQAYMRANNLEEIPMVQHIPIGPNPRTSLTPELSIGLGSASSPIRKQKRKSQGDGVRRKQERHTKQKSDRYPPPLSPLIARTQPLGTGDDTIVSRVEVATSGPLAQLTPPSHSTISQQMVVSHIHEAPRLPSPPCSETVDVETSNPQPQTAPSLLTKSLVSSPSIFFPFTKTQTTFVAPPDLDDLPRTLFDVSWLDASQGLSGSPPTVTITAAANVGHRTEPVSVSVTTVSLSPVQTGGTSAPFSDVVTTESLRGTVPLVSPFVTEARLEEFAKILEASIMTRVYTALGTSTRDKGKAPVVEEPAAPEPSADSDVGPWNVPIEELHDILLARLRTAPSLSECEQEIKRRLETPLSCRGKAQTSHQPRDDPEDEDRPEGEKRPTLESQ